MFDEKIVPQICAAVAKFEEQERLPRLQPYSLGQHDGGM